MKKISLIKKIFLIIIFLLSTSIMGVSAASYPKKITVGKLTWLDDYMGYEVDFNYKESKDGTIVYCLEYPKDVPAEGMSLSYEKEADAGLTYIIKNGYPSKSFTGNNKKDYFITQVAIWIYLEESTTGLDLIKRDMTTKNSIMHSSLKSLVEGAKKAKKEGYKTANMNIKVNDDLLTLSSDGKYYVSKELGIDSVNLTSNYTVSLTNAPKDTLIQTVNGKDAFQFSPNTKFIIKVPVSNVKELKTGFTVNISTESSIDKTYIYTTGNNKYQKLIFASLYPLTKTLKDETKLNIHTDKVIINKIDSETGKNIAGATLVIKDEKGKIVEEFITTTNSKVIMNLPTGKYTITETKAPNGYEKTDKVYTFEITNKGKENKIDVPNVELVHTAQVEISKQDVTTSKELPGAKLTIKDSKGKVVESWVSTERPHYLTLEVGKYTLIEEIAPNGYILSKEEIKFEITKDTKDVVKKVMYNTPEPKPEEPKEEVVVEVPKTDVNSSVFYGITASISALGYGLMKKFGKR